jgi:hypothetical protein
VKMTAIILLKISRVKLTEPLTPDTSTFQFDILKVSNELPEIGYITLMDQYILMCFAFKLGAFFFHVIQTWIDFLQDSFVDKSFAIVYIFCIVVVHAVFYAHARVLSFRRRKHIKLQCDIAEENNGFYRQKLAAHQRESPTDHERKISQEQSL